MPPLAPPKIEKGARAAKAKLEKAEKMKASTRKTYASLKEISCDMIWRSIIRTSEVERRLQKADQAERDLQNLTVSDPTYKEDKDIAGLLAEIGPYKQMIADIKDLCKDLRNLTPETAAECVQTESEISSRFLQVFDSLLSERDMSTLMDMVLSLSKKLMDVDISHAPCYLKIRVGLVGR